MTTEDDFRGALDANPADWQTRLVFADWLQERGDPRAEGYRALGEQRRVPDHAPHERGTVLWWWTCLPDRGDCRLPADWFQLIEGLTPYDERFKPLADPGAVSTRREVEDAAALAFAKLPPERRAELLAPADPASPRPKRARRTRRGRGA
jgi:uncharacterized protein (TIGR02996 family)